MVNRIALKRPHSVRVPYKRKQNLLPLPMRYKSGDDRARNREGRKGENSVGCTVG